MPSARELEYRAWHLPAKKLSERLKDGRILTVAVSEISNPGIKTHRRSFWYIDGKRIARVTAALILRGQI